MGGCVGCLLDDGLLLNDFEGEGETSYRSSARAKADLTAPSFAAMKHPGLEAYRMQYDGGLGLIVDTAEAQTKPFACGNPFRLRDVAIPSYEAWVACQSFPPRLGTCLF